jgi:peptide/nickel transport system substrate-binding protein
VVNDRSAAGAASVAMFVDDFPWNPNVPLPPPDPARARQLVAEAKQAGWDGKIRLACASDTQAKDVGLAVETMLKAVGIDVQPEAGVDTRALVDKVIVKRDYDLACWGLTVSPDDGAQAQLDTFLRSTSPSNRTGYKSSTMDAALDKLKVATTDDQRTAAYRDLAQTVLSDVPAVVMAALPERIAWNSNVHGVRSVSSGSVMFDGAWLQS